MESIQNNRLVRRCFKCSKCKDIEAKLVNPFVNNVYCSKCSTLLNEIPEIEYKKLKKKINLNQREDIKEGNHQSPYRPNEELLKRASGKYNNRPPSNKHSHHRDSHKMKHKDSKKNTNSGKHKTKKDPRQIRNQSSTHYSDMNFNNMNNYNNNMNINQNYNNNQDNYNQQHNNINQINFVDNDTRDRHQRRHEHHGSRRREHSTNPMNSNNFFSNFFRGFGFQPFIDFEFSIESPFTNNQHGHNPFRIIVQRQNVSNDIFDPIFSSFGSLFNGAFQDNYSSNFSSNYRGNFFEEILRILERNQAEAQKNAHPPASEESLKKLKKFSMSQKYCKKDKKGKYELPNCCICLSEIEKGEKTVLLPCGHMFHWKCCLTWLKSNNTCPMCRFEIK